MVPQPPQFFPMPCGAPDKGQKACQFVMHDAKGPERELRCSCVPELTAGQAAEPMTYKWQFTYQPELFPRTALLCGGNAALELTTGSNLITQTRLQSQSSRIGLHASGSQKLSRTDGKWSITLLRLANHSHNISALHMIQNPGQDL